MYTPNLKEFLKLCTKGNVIPLYKEINADLDTPVSVFLKIHKNDYSFLFESVEGQEKTARYSFLGCNPSMVFKSKAHRIEIIYPPRNKTRIFSTKSSALIELKKLMRNFKSVLVPGLPRFYGGMVGYMGYDMVRFFEEIPDKNPDDLKLADSFFILTDTILIFDHVNHTIKIVKNIILPTRKKLLSYSQKKQIYQEALDTIEGIQRDFNTPIPKTEESLARSNPKTARANCTKTGFARIVKKAKNYIKKGDIIQVVLSQRFRLPLAKPAFAVYRALRSLNPSPYMYYLALKDTTLIGASPEMLVRCEEGVVRTRPIAGTRRRGKDSREDEMLKGELINDEKERAEHLMLVDLGRNDLGRVCQSGTVEVSEFMSVEKYSHVMHLVSEVKGKLDNTRFDVYDVLQATFPAGTVSGSPKIRAMEIIDELENLRRGPYAGCVGYFSFSHNMDTCITIRTIVAHKGYAYIQAGAGIVADSIADREYTESVNKAKALIEAVIS